MHLILAIIAIIATPFAIIGGEYRLAWFTGFFGVFCLGSAFLAEYFKRGLWLHGILTIIGCIIAFNSPFEDTSAIELKARLENCQQQIAGQPFQLNEKVIWKQFSVTVVVVGVPSCDYEGQAYRCYTVLTKEGNRIGDIYETDIAKEK